jgi:hypothetical protein
MKWGPTPNVVMTRGAQATFDVDHPEPYLARHFNGDWGEVGKDDWEQNDRMVADKGMILSAYKIATGEKIWIITDPGHEVTTILLPEEY